MAVREATRNGTYLQFQPSGARVGRSQVSNRPELTAKLLLKQLQPQSNVRGKRTLFLVHLPSPRVQFLWTASRRTTALCSSIAKGCTFPVIEQDRINIPDQPFGGSQVIKFSPPPHSHDGSQVITIIRVEYNVGVHTYGGEGDNFAASMRNQALN